MDSWIRCRVDLYAFFLRCFNILCYASGFYMLLFVVRCLWCARMHARARVLFIGIVQRNWACLTWKSAIEIKSLLLLLLLHRVSGKQTGEWAGWRQMAKRKEKRVETIGKSDPKPSPSRVWHSCNRIDHSTVPLRLLWIQQFGVSVFCVCELYKKKSDHRCSQQNGN